MTRVLVVDDKEENRYYLQALLTGHGFAVTMARHGAEALVLARQHGPNLIVSDLLMPVMDGYTLLRHWRSDPALRHLPFIVYTATYTETEDEQLAMNLGADAFILKPAEPDDFLARIREVEARPRATATTLTAPGPDETELLKVYSEALIRKLEEKTLQLEEANRVLQQDIVNRMAAEAALREAQVRISEQASLLDKTRDAILVRDLEHRVTYLNRSAERIYGWPAEALLGRSVLETLRADPIEFDAATAHLLAHGEWAGELRKTARSGAVLTMDCRWTLMRGDDHPEAILAIETDVTERKLLEQQFLRAQRLESIGTLAGGIAHDLNNMLAPIMLSIELLKMDLDQTTRLDLLSTIEASARRGADMVGQVLSFARGVEGRRVDVELRRLLRDVEKIANDTFLKNIEVRTVLPAQLPPVIGDPTQLHQVLLNLCVNARDAMADGGTLTLLASEASFDAARIAPHPKARPGRYVVVQVEDTGAGMPQAVIDRIFEPFFTTKAPGKGTGLGLSTSLAIVRSHEGFIEVESTPGKGSRFRVCLPAQAGEASDADRVGAVALPRGRGELVLVVDDEASARQLTRQTLETFGYRVLEAASGADAVSMYALQPDRIAVVLADMMMPVMDGPATIAVLRKANPAVRIVGTSGLTTGGNALGIGDTRIDHFLPKPYTAEALLTILRDVLQTADSRRN
jgi:PAS domain S-box-containing protein